MGSSSKKKDKDRECSRKRRHKDGSIDEVQREKKRKHKKHHHKDRKREKQASRAEYQSGDSDVEIIEILPSPKAQNVKEPSPEVHQHHHAPSKQNTESLSIDDTNRLRAKLGLKPLAVGTSSVGGGTSSSSSGGVRKGDKKKDDLGEFYHKPAENWREKEKQEKIRNKISEQKERRKQQEKLSKVKLLGEGDSDDEVTSWVDKNRSIERDRKEAEKRAKMLEELDAQFGVSEIIDSEQKNKRSRQYTNKNLQGLRVDHDVGTFKDEQTVILTLKDQGVLDEDDDVLINVNMVDDERYKKNIENKKRKPQYNAYDNEEFDEFGNPIEKSLLSKYDEEIDGEKRESFVIGSDTNSFERKRAMAQSVKEKLSKTKVVENLSNIRLKLASDYYNEDEIAKFNKPKRKVRKIRTKGKLTADDLEQVNNKGIESVGSRRPKYKNDPDVFNIDDVPYVDIPTDMKLEDDKDDILEKALHKARKIKQKENVVAELVSSIPVKMETSDESIDGAQNIILNATAEFCRTLGDIPTYGKAGNRDETEDIIDYEKDILDEDANMDEVKLVEKSGWNSVDPNEAQETMQVVPQEVQILDEEPDVSTGVGAALKLAMSKGYLDKEQNNRPSNSRLAHLQAKHYSIEDKTYGDDNDRQNRRERYCGPVTEFKEKDTFKPNVKLEYIDDDGHILNSKEAFRYLSHKFHGKGPGKNKIEKRIKKSVQEQLMKKMSSTDTPLGTLNMLQAKQKETQSPFVVLSGSKQSQSTIISKSSRR